MDARTAALDRTAFWILAAGLGLAQVKLLPAQVLFGVAALLWLGLVLRGAAPFTVPRFFLPLAVYAGLTFVSALFSDDRAASLEDCKQLVLFLIVPVTAALARGARAMRVVDVVIAIGGAVALVGIVQWATLGYDHLDNRPRGLLSHWMTYSGVLMLVTCAAFARLLFHGREFVWPAVAVPALLVALAFSYTRNAWLGTAAALAVLFLLRNWRLLLILPVAALIVFVAAPDAIRARAASIGDMTNPTNRDRFAMMAIGRDIVADHPLTGVGPDRIIEVYAEYRPRYDEYAVNPTNFHLHNVPLQIAAERGLPALAVWFAFVIVLVRGFIGQRRDSALRFLPNAGLAIVAAMLAAGMFEYNFGDSEFLMLFLLLVTLPYAALRTGEQPA